jgi:hypothetical protein
MSRGPIKTYHPGDILAKERELAKWAQKRDWQAQKLNEAVLTYNNLDTIVMDLQRQLSEMRRAVRS